jgi:GTP cyclohydrolase I
MKDTQAEPDERGVAIDSVGICGLRWPIVVWDKEKEKQATVGTFKLSVSLPEKFKGTHMSRFIEALNESRGEITFRTLPQLVSNLRHRLDAPSAQVQVDFPYFIEKQAPVTKATAFMDFQCWFRATGTAAERTFEMGIQVPVTSLCPCSKAISDYGAHNQRGYIGLEIRPCIAANGDVSLIWLEELVAVAESAASCPVFPLLKREDERHVTMRAYDKPAFVEDMVRDCATALKANERIAAFRVTVENHESIHNHAAFAEIAWQR